MVLTRYSEAAAFLAAAHPLLAADPVGTTVIGSALHELMGEQASSVARPPWFATITGDGSHQPAGLAMRVGEYPATLYRLDAAQAEALAGEILATGEQPGGVAGDEPAARAFAERVAASRGGRVEIERAMRLHRLAALAAPTGVGGRARIATAADLDLTTDWVLAFTEEIGEGPSGDVAAPQRRAAQREVQERRAPHTWLWVDEDDTPVSLAAARPPAFGVARIGPVYTPPEHRSRGYAAAVTAHASAVIRAGGCDVVLFTDLANPTSNGVYARIGFVPVEDRLVLRVVDG